MVERIAFQRARQQSPATEVESTERQPTVSCKRITPEVIAEVGQVFRGRLVAGDPNFRRSCVAPLVEQATVPAERIRLTGTRSAIRHLVVSDKPPLAGLVAISDGIGARPSPQQTSLSTKSLIIDICRVRSGFDPAGKLSRGTHIFPEARKSLAFAGRAAHACPQEQGTYCAVTGTQMAPNWVGSPPISDLPIGGTVQPQRCFHSRLHGLEIDGDGNAFVSAEP